MKKKTEVTPSVAEQPQQFVEVINQHGVDVTEASRYARIFLPYMSKVQDSVDEALAINFDNPTEADAKLARKIRLSLVPNRKEAEGQKDFQKKEFLIKSNLIQSLYNVVKSSSELLEENLMRVEKHAERMEAERVAKLKEERHARLSEFMDNATGFPVEAMTEEAFEAFLSSQKLAMEARVRAEKEAQEIEEIRRATAERANRFRARLLPVSSYIMGFNSLDLELINEADVEELFAVASSSMQADKEKAAAAEKERQAMLVEQQALRDRIRQAEASAAKAQQEAEEAKRRAQEVKEVEREAHFKVDAGMTDRESIAALAHLFSSIEMPEVDSPNAQALVENVEILQRKVVAYIVEGLKKI